MSDSIKSNYTPIQAPTSYSYSSSKSPSAELLHKYGVTKSTALYMQQNHWVIDKDYADVFSTYYLLRWEAAYFQDRLHEGTIERNDITYQVIYYRCNAAAISAPCQGKQLLLSFRSLQDEYKVQPTVLVTIA